MDLEIIGRSLGRIRNGGCYQLRSGASHAKKNEVKPWLKKQWCIAPRHQAEFVCQMEDVLAVYERALDEERPLVCLDETTKQLVKETRRSLPAKPGHPHYIDYEYERAGVATLFMLCAPLLGWREVRVTEKKTGIDYAHCLQYLAETVFAQAHKIVLVQDNLNTHTAASLYRAFRPQKARELIERFEFHYTPTHASWLNVAECELSAMTRQCLNRRIADRQTLAAQLQAWQQARNDAKVGINWQFTNQDARIKLQRFYPSI